MPERSRGCRPNRGAKDAPRGPSAQVAPSLLTLALHPMKLPSSHIKPSASSGPEQDAAELLHATWIGEDGTIVIPVDPFYIAKRLGIQVFTASLDQGVSGLLRKEAGYDDPRIYVNSSDSRNRQRFTCAHELGHYIRRGSGKAADGS